MFWVILGVGVVVALGIFLIGGMSGRGGSVRRDAPYDGGTTSYVPIADSTSHRARDGDHHGGRDDSQGSSGHHGDGGGSAGSGGDGGGSSGGGGDGGGGGGT